ncbi:hypothetical protein [Serratia marcescens]|uniref:hypothetical protein n=1 Tax=Serratia marcescens TaxID=615 RepID=UPI0040463BDE
MQTITTSAQPAAPSGWVDLGGKGVAAVSPSNERRLFSCILEEDDFHELKHVQHSLDLLIQLADLAANTNDSTIQARDISSILGIVCNALKSANSNIVELKGLHSLESLGVEVSDVK